MKQLFLLIAAAVFALGANAQQATDAAKLNQKKLRFDSEYQRTTPPPTINYSEELKATTLEKIFIGKAHSQRSFRREDCRNVAYNKDLDMITVTFIIDEETYPDVALSDGSVGIFYSIDHGQTWAGPVLLSDLSDQEKRNYYCSGNIYNPGGNAIIEDAYGVYQGIAPDNPGGTIGDWNNQAFGASTFGGANYYTEFTNNPGTGHGDDGYYSQFGLTQVQDYMKCFNIWTEGDWAAFNLLKLEDIQGTFNGTGFDWDLEHSIIEIPFNIDNDDEAMWPGKWTWSDVGADIVWSEDGQTGYAWMVGAHENMETGWWPIVFRTNDNGNSWDEIELDFFDNDIQDVIKNGEENPYNWVALPCVDLDEQLKDFIIPYFRATAGAVDAAGNLQLFADITGHYYDHINDWEYYEYINNTWNRAGGIFRFTIGDELIDATLVDSLMSHQAQDQLGSDSLYLDNGWLHRLHVTKDERSEEFFVTWNDTPEGDRFMYNYLPDVKGWSYNITTGTHTDPVCFTCDVTLPFEHYWFISASDYAYYNASDETFTVPMVSGVSLDDFYANSNATEDATEVEYVTDITFDAIVPISVGLDELSGQSKTFVSQNLPNPASGITTIEISSETIAAVTVELTNMIGQTVLSQDAGIINKKMSVDIDVSNLEAGIYLYTVTVGSEHISNRMVVR